VQITGFDERNFKDTLKRQQMSEWVELIPNQVCNSKYDFEFGAITIFGENTYVVVLFA
jgi:hypothetical protein